VWKKVRLLGNFRGEANPIGREFGPIVLKKWQRGKKKGGQPPNPRIGEKGKRRQNRHLLMPGGKEGAHKAHFVETRVGFQNLKSEGRGACYPNQRVRRFVSTTRGKRGKKGGNNRDQK